MPGRLTASSVFWAPKRPENHRPNTEKRLSVCSGTAGVMRGVAVAAGRVVVSRRVVAGVGLPVTKVTAGVSLTA
jgi:hypothetical protein